MSNNKKSKKESIEKLRNVLDDISIKDLPPEDAKYLRDLRKRLDRQSKDVVIKKTVSKEVKKGDPDYLKPKVVIHAREVKKDFQFIEVKEEVQLKEEPSSDVEFLEVGEKEARFEDEDIIEVEKVEVKGPEFIQVKPKEPQKKEKEGIKEDKKTLKDDELTEWEPVEAEETVEEKKKIEFEPVEDKPEITDKRVEFEEISKVEEKKEEEAVTYFCTRCGNKLDGKDILCVKCGHEVTGDIEKSKEETKDAEKAESIPTFIPIKPTEEEKEPEWEPVEDKPVKDKLVEDKPVEEEKEPEWEPVEEIEQPPEKQIEVEVKENIIEDEVKFEAFKGMESIDNKTAILLYDNGYTTIDFLQDATVKDLTKIKGIKRRTAKKIKAELERKIIEAAEVKPIVTDENAEGELTEEQIEKKVVKKKKTKKRKPVELKIEESEWKPKEEEIDEPEEDDSEKHMKIEIFKDMKSINDETAVLLYDNGFTSVDALAGVDIKNLTKIKGVKKNTAKRIIKELEEKAEWQPLKTENQDFFEEEEPEKVESKELEEKIIEYEPIVEAEEDFFEEEEEVEDIPPIEMEKDSTFKGIKSIDDKIAKLLKDNGIDSLDKIDQMTIKELTKIRGIRKKTAKEIKQELKDLKSNIELDKSFERGENPFIKDEKSEDEWETFDEEKVTDSKMSEFNGFVHGDYALYEKEIDSKSGKKQKVRFFSKAEPEGAEPIELPNGYEVKENKKTGVPYLKKKK